MNNGQDAVENTNSNSDEKIEHKGISKDEAIAILETLSDEVHSKFTGKMFSTIEMALEKSDSRLDPTKKNISRHITDTTFYIHRQVVKCLNAIDGGSRSQYKTFKPH